MKGPSLAGLDAEIRDHIERETQDNIAQGMSPDAARRAAFNAFGNRTTTREEVRAVWIPVWLEQLGQDLRYAARSLRRNPLFTLIVVGTLAIGIGLTTAVFGVFNAILLRPLDYPDAARLVVVGTESPELPSGQDLANNQDFWDWKDQATSLDALFAYNVYDQTLGTGDDPVRVRTAVVSADFWPVSGARVVAGRLPAGDEPNVALLSEPLFERLFSRDPQTIGRVVTLDRTTVTIVGVLPGAFRLQVPMPRRPGLQDKDVDLVRSFTVPKPNGQFRQLLSLVGRVRPGIDRQAAAAELSAIYARGSDSALRRGSVLVAPLTERMVRHVRRGLNVLLAGVGFVLLVACTNVADLLLARMSARSKEMAVRVSVGAGRSRVLRQLLLESVAYCVIGGLGALAIARWGLATVIRVYPYAAPRLAESTIDRTVLTVTLVVVAATGVFVALIPAIALQRANVHDILKEGGRTASASPRRLRTRRVLVGAQLALAVALLCGAGLLLKSFWAMTARPDGFAPDRILTMRLNFPSGSTGPAKVALADRVLARIKALPGVTAASLNSHGDLLTWFDIAGTPKTPREQRQLLYLNQTSPEFANVMGLRLLKGRWLADAEPRPVVVLNETARRLRFGNEDPVGQTIEGLAIGEPMVSPQDPSLQPTSAIVVGVVADLRYTKLDEDPVPEFYLPYGHARSIYRMNLVVRTAGDPAAIVPAMRAALGEFDKNEKPFDVMTLEESLRDSIAPRRFNLVVLLTFAATSLLLALVGIYGVMLYSVSQRGHELGIRSALGAQRRDVVAMVVRQGMGVAFAGISVGLIGALLLTRTMGGLLYAVEPGDPLTFIAAAALLAVTAFAACLGPALKAALVNPLVALRCE